ncbi:ABC transporter ATP-binding protein [Pararobbsia silviterrae]|uniref:ABC transporter ATP-binding protein n=1 Tax=Pararobbsia silviterrae TaxID=1792498 RepID=A0A494XDF5_9BURK|nr:ABC transporter ATP-binding protein [Pararobbsia silviterrae]RKP46189.1 ABC transporter ATP-binding protein [Pararobbsia silviterrae]
MAHIIAENVVVEFPIYQGTQRSMRKTFLAAATGGKLSGTDRGVSVRAIDNLTLHIENGERVGLLGHNGSGKTTMLRALSGIYEPASGRLDVQGSVTSLLDIAQGFDVDATGEENIVLRAITMGLPVRTIRPLIPEISEFSGLGDYLKLPVRTYSSGMTLRLAFAISTSVGADILLMDEWLSVGDDEFRERAKERLTHLINQSGIVVLASHDKDLLHRVCSRILHISHGKIVHEERGQSASSGGTTETVGQAV